MDTHKPGPKATLTVQTDTDAPPLELVQCQFRSLFEQVGVGVAELDGTTLRIVRLNRAFEQLLERTSRDLYSRTFAQLGLVPESPQSEHDTVAQRISDLVNGAETHCTFYASYPLPNESIRNFKITISKLSAESLPAACVLILDDVTEQKQTELQLQKLQHELELRVKQRTAELEQANEALRQQAHARKQISEALRQSVALYRTIATSIPHAAVLVVEQDRRFRVAEGKLLPLLGTSRNQLEGTMFDRDSSHAVGRLFIQIFERALAGKTASIEQAIDNRILHIVHTPLRSAEADIVGAVALILDVTDRQRSEAERQRIDQRYWELITTANEGIWFVDRDLRTTFLNEQMAHQLGYSRSEILDAPFPNFIFPEDIPEFLDRWHKITLGADLRYESRFKKKDNSEVWMRASIKVLHDDQGHFGGAFGMFTDITEQRAAEERLRISEQRFRLITEASMEGILVYSTESHRIRYVNPAACQMLGYSDAELSLQQMSDLYSARHPSYDVSAGNAGRRTPWAESGELRRKDGSRVRVGMKSVVLELEGERCLALFLTDLTMSSLLDQERTKAQKLEALGTLAGGIAHDFNNLLQAVSANISMARWAYDDKEEAIARLDSVEHSLQLAIKLTGQLLAFSKGGTLHRKPMSLGPLIEEATRFMLSGSKAVCHVAVAENLWPVEADEGQLTQVLHNVLLNADQAMPNGGTITVSVRNVQAPSGRVPVLLPGGRWVEISVADTGVGIDKEHMSRIFDPYFSTKPTGTGLGLSTTYAIIRKHDGHIDVKSLLGKGTEVSIYLPASERKPIAGKAVQTTAETPSFHVLLLDDDGDIRETSSALLSALGHTVVAVETGEDAISAYQRAMRSARRFDLVLLDLTIRGGLGGLEALKVLLTVDHKVRAILSSGYSDDTLSLASLPSQAKRFLPKPYTMNQLRDAIAALMEDTDHAA